MSFAFTSPFMASMRRLTRVALSLALAVGLSPATASDTVVDIAEEMGFAAPTPNAIEVRIWVLGALVVPYDLYRFREKAGGVKGQHFVWYGLHRPDDAATNEEHAKSNENTTRIFNKFCASAVRRTPNVIWCSPHVISTDKEWAKVFRALPVRELWKLPEQSSLGTRPCAVMDGGSVGIELVSAQRRHYVEYSNPHSCCPWPECKVATKVLDLVSTLR